MADKTGENKPKRARARAKPSAKVVEHRRNTKDLETAAKDMNAGDADDALRAIAAFRNRPRRPQAVLVREPGGRFVRHAPDGEDEVILLLRQLNAVGSTSIDFLDTTIGEILGVIKNGAGAVTSKEYNSVVAFLLAVAPQNEMEAKLAAQMFAANEAAMQCAKNMGEAGFLPQAQAFGNLAVKFMRTYAAQVETLAKLRRGGEQVVKHVHVYEGGQAVVAGTVNNHRGGGVRFENDAQSDAPATAGIAAPGAALPSPDEAGDLVPISGREREAALSHARWDKSGRSEG